MRDPASYRSNTCRLTFDVPWELAEFLADHGEELIGQLRQLVEHRRGYKRVCAEATSREEASMAARRRATSLIVKQVAREARRRVSRRGCNQTRSEVITELAERYGPEAGLTAPLLAQLVRRRETAVQACARARRDALIVRLYEQGIKGHELAEAVGVSRLVAYRTIRRHHELTASRQEASA